MLIFRDFEGNQITHLERGAVKVKTEQLWVCFKIILIITVTMLHFFHFIFPSILDNNQIGFIDAEAFKGSQVAKLYVN